jgi:outer membrane receptor for ferrienterochelin and colicins
MRLLAFAILAACAQSVCAQSILKDPKELSVLLNEVVVTGTGTEHYLKDAPVQTEVIPLTVTKDVVCKIFWRD